MQRNGFTLVELMVVIAIMALFAGAAAMTVGDLGRGSGDEANRFAARLAAARDEAIVGQVPIAGWVTASGYGFERLSGGRWEALAVKPFEGADWDKGTALSLGKVAGSRARIRFDNLGLPDAPLSVTLERSGRTARILVAANGDVAVR